MKLVTTDFKSFTKHLTNISVLEYIIEILPKCNVNGPWIAGGCLHRTYRNLSLTESDIDVFFKDKEQLDKFILELNASSIDNTLFKIKSMIVSEWHHTLELEYMNNVIKIQCVSFKYFESIEKLFESFDINLCRVAYDGTNVIHEENALNDIHNNQLRFNQGSIFYPSVTLKRLIKYVKMGYNIEDNDLKILSYAFFNSKKKAIDILDQDSFTKKSTNINTYQGL